LTPMICSNATQNAVSVTLMIRIDSSD
jgi:hypothetical protein